MVMPKWCLIGLTRTKCIEPFLFSLAVFLSLGNISLLCSLPPYSFLCIGWLEDQPSKSAYSRNMLHVTSTGNCDRAS